LEDVNTVVPKLDNTFQAALSFWSTFGDRLAQYGSSVVETMESLVRSNEQVLVYAEISPGATEEWLSQPLNSPEFWIQAAFFIRAIDGVRTDEAGGPFFKGEVQVSTAGKTITQGIRDMYPFEALCLFIAESVIGGKGLRPQMDTNDDFIRLAHGLKSSALLHLRLHGLSPFTQMSPIAALIYKALCLRLPYKAVPQAEDAQGNSAPQFYWGTGVPFTGDSNKVSVLSNSATPTDSAPVESYPDMEQSFRAVGLTGFADLIETNTKASKQQMLAFSKALTRKGKRL
jgi:hypothetical protein